MQSFASVDDSPVDEDGLARERVDLGSRCGVGDIDHEVDVPGGKSRQALGPRPGHIVDRPPLFHGNGVHQFGEEASRDARVIYVDLRRVVVDADAHIHRGKSGDRGRDDQSGQQETREHEARSRIDLDRTPLDIHGAHDSVPCLPAVSV